MLVGHQQRLIGLLLLGAGAELAALQLLEQRLGPVHHRRRDARQLCHVDAIRFVGAAGHHLVQEDDVLAVLRYVQVEVAHLRQPLLHLDQLVVVRGEERARAALRVIVQILDDGPGDSHAVVGAGPTPHLVQNKQAARRGVVEDVRRLHHLHHKGRLTRRQLVRSADAREDAVRHPDVRRVRRDETAHLRHQHDQRGLPQKDALARHVRPGDDVDALVSVHRQVVGREGLALRALDHGMAPGLDPQDRRLIKRRADVAIAQRHLRQRRGHVQSRQRLRRAQQRRRVGRYTSAYLLEKPRLQLADALLGVEDAAFVLLELRRDVALRVDQRLLTLVVVGYPIEIGLGHLDVVAVDLVVANLEALDARPLLLLLLQPGDPVASVLAGVDDAIQILREAGADQPAAAYLRRRIVDDSARDKLSGLAHRIEPLQQRSEARRRVGCGLLQLLAQRRHRVQRGADAHKIPGRRPSGDHAVGHALQVRDALERLAHLGAEHRGVDEALNLIQTQLQRGDIQQRMRQPV